ncbi:MAG: DUF6273 domain-containing protein [Clostridia bacterium]|nr:DUF6273 domain-containing protein [Clostridia bacterium]
MKRILSILITVMMLAGVLAVPGVRADDAGTSGAGVIDSLSLVFLKRRNPLIGKPLDYNCYELTYFMSSGTVNGDEVPGEDLLAYCEIQGVLTYGADGTLTPLPEGALIEADKTYFSSCSLYAAEGYVLSDDLTVLSSQYYPDESIPTTVTAVNAGCVEIAIQLPAPQPVVDPDDPRMPLNEPLTYEVRDGLYVGEYPAGNCRWTFDPYYGEMIFYATGENATVPPGVQDYDLLAPYDFRFDVRSVYVDEGIRYIGYGAFSYMFGLRELILPSTLENAEMTDEYGNYHVTPYLAALKSLETIVVKSKTVKLFLDVWTSATTDPFPTFMSFGPINDVNEKRALMDIRCAYYNTIYGYRQDMDLDPDGDEPDFAVVLQPLVDAANRKYGAHLPDVTSMDIVEWLLTDVRLSGKGGSANGDNTPKLCPAYFRLICAPDSAVADEWQALKESMLLLLIENYEDEVDDPDFNPNVPGATPDPDSYMQLYYTTLIEPYHEEETVYPIYENALVDIATYTETKPASYVDPGSGQSSPDADFSVGDLVTFGSYPQTRVTDPSLLDALNSQTLDWTYYDYYVGGVHEDFMKYADVTVSGVRYRAVQFSHYRPRPATSSDYTNTFQDDNGYEPGQVYWFKFEPIVWRVLDPSAGLLMTESIIDSQTFHNENHDGYGDAGKTHYASDWAYSSLRSWMNGDFYNTAFYAGQNFIKDTSLTTPSSYLSEYDADPTTDKVFLLAREDALNEAYGFSSYSGSGSDTNRTAFGTDYAKCQGLDVDSSTGNYYSGASSWRLRTPSADNGTDYVNCDSIVDDYNITYLIIGGIRPALNVDLKSAVAGSLIRPFTGIETLEDSGVTLSWTSKAYNSSVQKPAVTVKNAADETLAEGTDYTLEWSGDSKLPGTYTVTVNGTGIYTGSVSKTYIIGKQALAASRISLSWTNKAYNSAVQKPTVTVKNAAGTKLTEGTSYTLEWSDDSKLPGNYTVTVKGKGSFSGSVPMTYTIGKQALAASRITLSWTDNAYNGEVRKPTVTVKNAAGTKLTEGTSYTLEWSGDSKLPGNYTVTVKGKGSFSGSVPMTYTIGKQALAASRITLSLTDNAYNGEVRKPTVTVKNAAGLKLTEGTSYTLEWSGDSELPGTYTVTV